MCEVGIVVHDDYEFIPNAYGTTRLGYVHGFQNIGMEASLISHSALADWITAQELPPLLWLTWGDYYHMNTRTLEAVGDCPHIVQVNTWFEGMEKLHASFGAPDPQLPEEMIEKIVASKPTFVWCSAPDAYLEFYQGWRDVGLKVVSLPWACDSTKYADSKLIAHGVGGIVFVGGYRAYKEPQYAAYLWPYDDKLKVWGYSEWPRCYQGVLPEAHEPGTYAIASVCPTISEPQFAVTGDTVERPFKVLGSGGLTVFDPVPAYKCLFKPGEALIPEDEAEYHEMMALALYDPDANALYRKRGREAVRSRHLYRHRAEKIVAELC